MTASSSKEMCKVKVGEYSEWRGHCTSALGMPESKDLGPNGQQQYRERASKENAFSPLCSAAAWIMCCHVLLWKPRWLRTALMLVGENRAESHTEGRRLKKRLVGNPVVGDMINARQCCLKQDTGILKLVMLLSVNVT